MVEFSPATREARVRFPASAVWYPFATFFWHLTFQWRNSCAGKLVYFLPNAEFAIVNYSIGAQLQNTLSIQRNSLMLRRRYDCYPPIHLTRCLGKTKVKKVFFDCVFGIRVPTSRKNLNKWNGKGVLLAVSAYPFIHFKILLGKSKRQYASLFQTWNLVSDASFLRMNNSVFTYPAFIGVYPQYDQLFNTPPIAQ